MLTMTIVSDMTGNLLMIHLNKIKGKSIEGKLTIKWLTYDRQIDEEILISKNYKAVKRNTKQKKREMEKKSISLTS